MSAPAGWIQTIQGHAASLNANWQSFLLQQHHHQINKTIGKQLTADELQAHPEYPHVNWDLKAEKQGRVEVAKDRGGPLKIAYEIHGTGSKKLVFIMGLGGYMKSWQRQTKDFGHTHGSEYSCLIFDNRGIGDSDKPVLRYTTSEMATDVVELLDHLGWTESRSLHIIGISMGGMIAQELGLQISARVCSLNLISTAPRIVRTLPFMENVRNRLNLMWPKPLDGQIAKVKADCYSAEWLAQMDDTEHVVQSFPTNGDRFAAGEVTKRMSPDAFKLTGFLCQLYAAGFHHKTAAQLKVLGDQVGRKRIMVFHGDNDHMVDFVHGKLLLEELGGEAGGVVKSFHTGIGHVAPLEIREEFARIITERVAATEAMGKGE